MQAGLLAQAPVRSTGPNFPHVLYATGRGLRTVRDAYARHGRRWDGPVTEEGNAKGLALDSVLHEVLVTEFDLAMYRTAARRDDLVLLERERRYFRHGRQLVYGQQGRTQRVVPDAGYLAAVRTVDGGQLLPLMLLELENGTHSVAKVRQKLRRYQQWVELAAGEYLPPLYARHGEPEKRSFRLLLVAHDKHGAVSDERRLLDLLLQSLDLARPVRNTIWLTTATALRNRQHDATPLDAPIWWRAKDAARPLPDIRASRQGGGQGQYAQRRKHLAARLADLPRHPLLPRPSPEPKSTRQTHDVALNATIGRGDAP